MEFVSLSNGVKMPMLGLGVYQVPDFDQCEQSVLDAFRRATVWWTPQRAI